MLKSQNNALAAENEVPEGVYHRSPEMLDLPKDEVSRLRKLDVSMVAERLGHMDEIRKGENAIDLTKRIGGFDYQQAVAWLHHEFGFLAAAAAVREQMEVSPRNGHLRRPRTRSRRQSTRSSMDWAVIASGCR